MRTTRPTFKKRNFYGPSFGLAQEASQVNNSIALIQDTLKTEELLPMTTPNITRREFIKTSSAATASALAFSRSAYSAVLGANDRIAFAVIGCGGMGTGHLGSLVKRSE